MDRVDSAAIGLLSLARRDRLTPGNIREELAGKAALLIKVKDRGLALLFCGNTRLLI